MPSKPVKRQWMKKNSKPTRAELIKKHGLATFHPDPEENRKLQETKGKDIDFTSEYGAEKTGFMGDTKPVGSTNAKKQTPRTVSYTHLTLPTNSGV